MRYSGRWIVLFVITLVALACAPGATNGGTPVTGVSDTSSATRSVARGAVNGTRVVAISLDGLNPGAITRLGPAGTPNLHRLMSHGAFTLNARAQVEQTVTLPNHTSMITGRRIRASAGGHGITWNVDRPHITVQMAAGHDVDSVFRTVHRAGGSTALYSTKAKFGLFKRSWPGAVDRSHISVENDASVTLALRRDLVARRRTFSFLHLGLPDQTGHARGWMSPAYLRAVKRADALVGSVMATIRSRPVLRRSTVVVLTSDHGGPPGQKQHSVATNPQNYRVPFMVWGHGVRRGNLYAMSPAFNNPGRTRPLLAGRQPIRNGDLANLVTDLLGVGPVPGSLWNRTQQLNWR